MTVEYVVLGAVLIFMGIIQAWLRHGPWGKELRSEQAQVAARRAERAKAAQESVVLRGASADIGDETGDAAGVAARDAAADASGGVDRGPEYDAVAAKVDKRAGRAWNAWTAILGPLSMAFGIVLLVLGLLGY